MSVDEYFSNYSGETLRRLCTIRSIIRAAASDAVESVAYAMPAYKLHNKPLVYFAGYDTHIGFYATPNGHEAFKTEFAHYVQGKGSVQFPHNQPLPEELIRRVVTYRIAEVNRSASEHQKTRSRA